MLILAVETATSRQSVALIKDDKILGSCSRGAEGSHTRWLIPTIDELLNEVGLEIGALSGLAVSIGPGSFTGLRAGLATMTGFRLALNLPLVAVSTLEAMAWNFPSEGKLICPMLKARAEEVYWAHFRWGQGRLARITDDQASSFDDVIRSFTQPTWVLGEGWSANHQKSKEKHQLARVAPPETMTASAVSVGFASLKAFRDGDIAELGISPRYILPSYAELKHT